MSDMSAVYADSMIWMCKKIQDWDKAKPGNPDMMRFVRMIKNITDYVQELEVDNRRMKRIIIDHDAWVNNNSNTKINQ